MKTTHACIGLATLATLAGAATAQITVGKTLVHPSHAAAVVVDTYSLAAHTGIRAPLAVHSDAWSNASNTFKGTVESWVYSNGSGSTFVYRFTVDPSSTGVLVRSSLTGDWADFTISSAGADSSGTGVVNGNPSWIQHSLSGIGIQWNDQQLAGATGVNPAKNSALVWFHTDATQWTLASSAALGVGTQAGSSVLVPLIPTPSTGIAALLGIGMLAARRRR